MKLSHQKVALSTKSTVCAGEGIHYCYLGEGIYRIHEDPKLCDYQVVNCSTSPFKEVLAGRTVAEGSPGLFQSVLVHTDTVPPDECLITTFSLL